MKLCSAGDAAKRKHWGLLSGNSAVWRRSAKNWVSTRWGLEPASIRRSSSIWNMHGLAKICGWTFQRDYPMCSGVVGMYLFLGSRLVRPAGGHLVVCAGRHWSGGDCLFRPILWTQQTAAPDGNSSPADTKIRRPALDQKGRRSHLLTDHAGSDRAVLYDRSIWRRMASGMGTVPSGRCAVRDHLGDTGSDWPVQLNRHIPRSLMNWRDANEKRMAYFAGTLTDNFRRCEYLSVCPHGRWQRSSSDACHPADLLSCMGGLLSGITGH